MAPTPRIISLFSGLGGLDYGFEAAGYETCLALDFDDDACRTLRHNRPRWTVIERPIEQVSSEALLSAAGTHDIDVVIGGPPCQPYSKSGYWRGDTLRLDDPRAGTLREYVRVIEEVLPKVFVLENVPGICFKGKDEGLRLLLQGIEQINLKHGTKYLPQYRVLHAVEHGVPQIRSRLFLVAARDGTNLRFPAPAFGPGLMPYRTAWDALSDLVDTEHDDLEMRGKWADLLGSIPEGENYLWHTERGGGLPIFAWRSRFWPFLLKLAKDRPSWTVQAQPGPAIGPFHWANRRLSMRELCRLQTIPDDVVVLGSRSAIQRQIGNAVPSLLAEVIAREVRTQLLGLPTLDHPPKLLPIDRAPSPPPEPVGQVPSRFRPRPASRIAGEDATATSVYSP